MRPIYLIFAGLIALSGLSFALQSITGCQVISSPDTYVLANDIGPSTPQCLWVQSSNVEIDCKGHTIIGPPTGAIGVRINASIANITVKNCNIALYSDGIRVFASANNVKITGNTVFGSGLPASTGTGISVLAKCFNIDITNNIIYNQDYGITLSGHDNTITSNRIYNNLGVGIGLMASNSTLSDNSVYSNAEDGILVDVSTSINNTLINNRVYNNSRHGIRFDVISNNTLINNRVYNNTINGIFIARGSNNTIINNRAYNNFGSGILLEESSTNNSLSGNSAYSNTDGIRLNTGSNNTLINNRAYSNANGLVVNNSDYANITNQYYSNNNQDFVVYGSGIIVNVANSIFDNPNGGFARYTNLSIYDAVNEPYSITWSADTTTLPLPDNYTSFAQKFVNITNLSSYIAIDRIVWHWTNAELGAYSNANESLLQLWVYEEGLGWSLLNNTPDTGANTLTLAPEPSSVYAILYNGTLIPLPPEEAGKEEAKKQLSLSFSSACAANLVTVKSRRDPVPGAVVKVNGDPVNTTDSSGQAAFPGCGLSGIVVSVSKSGYQTAYVRVDTIPCHECAACIDDSDCPSGYTCEGGQCVPEECYPECTEGRACVDGQCVCNYDCCADSDCNEGERCTGHICKPKYECTADSGCAANEYCNIPAGAAGGTCEEIPCACGNVQNHVCVQYECCMDADCPQGRHCADNVCTTPAEGDVACPTTGIIGESKSCMAKDDGQPCVSCDYQVTDPAGKKYSGKTDDIGNFEVPLAIEGTYQVTLFRGGEPVKTIEVKSLPRAPPTEEGKPTAASGVDGYLLWLFLVLVLIIAAVLYWRGRGGRKAGPPESKAQPAAKK